MACRRSACRTRFSPDGARAPVQVRGVLAKGQTSQEGMTGPWSPGPDGVPSTNAHGSRGARSSPPTGLPPGGCDGLQLEAGWVGQLRMLPGALARRVERPDPLVVHALGVVELRAGLADPPKTELVHRAGREGRVGDHDDPQAAMQEPDRRLRDANISLRGDESGSS